MFLQFLLYSKVTQSYIYTYTVFFFFPYYLPSCFSPRDWTEFLVLCSRTPWLIHPKCKSLHLITPTPPSISLNSKCDFSLTISVKKSLMTSNYSWNKDQGSFSSMWSHWCDWLSFCHLTYSTVSVVVSRLPSLALSKFQGILCFFQGSSHVFYP